VFISFFAMASVKITSAPGGATVSANGKELGQTPLVIEEVKPGDISYELSSPVTSPLRLMESRTAAAGVSGSAIERASDQRRDNRYEFVRHEVRSTRDIRISIWETRVQDLRGIFAGNRPALRADGFPTIPESPDRESQLVRCGGFLQMVTEKKRDENLFEDRQAYRLPTDKE